MDPLADDFMPTRPRSRDFVSSPPTKQTREALGGTSYVGLPSLIIAITHNEKIDRNSSQAE